MALPTLRIIGFIIGIFLITLAIFMVVPMATLMVFERTRDLPSFLWSSMITFLAGLALVLPGRPEHIHLRPRDMYLLTVSSWLVVCIFAALPFLLTQKISYTDSFFESMSGITATGATVLSGLDTMSPGILMWRSLLHWLGGIGFIGMAVAILPLLRIGGMRLFQTESSDRSEKVMPRSHMVARLIVASYVGITILGTLALWWAGMSLFDAINHAMSAISTGGFSTSDLSLAKWTQPAVHWVIIVIMILGSLPFALYVSMLRGNRRALIKDQQVQGLIGVLLVTWLVLGTWYWATTDLHWLEALRHVALNVTSIVTTTGFALGDYSLWGNFSLMLFFYLGFVGGCSGSTAGGIKIFRFQVAYILLRANLNQLIHPRAVIKQKYNGHRLDEEIVRSILTFSFFFAITICVIALLLSLLGVEWMTALTGAASTVSGVGPGLGKPSGRPATSHRCRTRPSGFCQEACCWADWRSSRCSCCVSRRSGVTDRFRLARQPCPVFARRGVEPAAEGPEKNCLGRQTPADRRSPAASCPTAPGTARPVHDGCPQANSGNWCPLPASAAARCAATGAASAPPRHAWARPGATVGTTLVVPYGSHGFPKNARGIHRQTGHATAPWLRWPSAEAPPCRPAQKSARHKTRRTPAVRRRLADKAPGPGVRCLGTALLPGARYARSASCTGPTHRPGTPRHFAEWG